METRYFAEMPVKSETREEGAAPRLECRFATFVGEYDMGYGCRERIGSHAFDETVGDDIRILWNHNSDIVLGRTAANTAELHIAPEGLEGGVDLNPKDSDAMNAHARVERGDVTGCSIGFDILSEHVDHLENGDLLFTIDKIKLYECSICTFPAYKDTFAHARSAGPAAQMRAFRYRMKERLNNVFKKAS